MVARFIAAISIALALLASSVTTAHSAPAKNPGAVVSVGDLPRDQWISGAQQSLLIEYWSVGPTGEPMLSSGSLFIPDGVAPTGGWPILARAHGTTGVGDECAPTVIGPGQEVKDYITRWLNSGFAVVATDYVGLGTPGVHPYLDGASAAHSVIDSVRAARTIDDRLSRKWGVIGISQGGHASMFTAHMATAVAPELDFRGTVAMAPPSNLESVTPLLGPYVPRIPLEGTTSYFAYVMYGLRAARPDLDVDSYLTPRGVEVLDQLGELCIGAADEMLRDTSLGELFSRPLLDSPLVGALHKMLHIPTSGYDRPIMLAQGLEDEVVPPLSTAKLYAELLANRVDVTPRVYPTDHIGLFAESQPDAIRFMLTVFDMG
ncbi:lipase family protein [Antrihabitans sp. YC2-6]|uniref:lipase family protein n=1 Tax=Antrihabitans sp. YC2-6 TaxID=2799498 RepID=UPI0018F2979F|nr:lipase family protein [Antrihabitans sp. YC2-6]MBJ8348947.1 alpha/beta fold hydrolase [Antrihabitans sp. YC2-6]